MNHWTHPIGIYSSFATFTLIPYPTLTLAKFNWHYFNCPHLVHCASGWRVSTPKSTLVTQQSTHVSLYPGPVPLFSRSSLWVANIHLTLAIHSRILGKKDAFSKTNCPKSTRRATSHWANLCLSKCWAKITTNYFFHCLGNFLPLQLRFQGSVMGGKLFLFNLTVDVGPLATGHLGQKDMCKWTLLPFSWASLDLKVTRVATFTEILAIIDQSTPLQISTQNSLMSG